MYRLYVDEVGSDELIHLDKDKHRFLSLTGVAIKVKHVSDALEPKMNWIKSNVFNHDPDSPLILHRKEIMGFKGKFLCLRNPETQKLFNKAILRMFETTEYTVITALLDKKWMLRQNHWSKTHPYHYLMEILVEKYAQFLERQNDIGDIMPESRQSKDRLLQNAFLQVRETGTAYASLDKLNSYIRGKNLKFRTKKDNSAGLQLCDLLAHPSHIYTRQLMKHDVRLGPFATQVLDVLLRSKYDRSPWEGNIIGYGIKHLPQ